MHFYFKCFYLTCIFNYVVVGSSDLEFHAMALGHSGLQIYWDPRKVNDTSHHFSLTYKALTSNHAAPLQAAMENTTKMKLDQNNFARGQYKLHSLNENTHYEVTIEELHSDNITITKSYTLKCKTDFKRNSPPEKPYFTWKVAEWFYYNHIEVSWVPCGKERNCHGNPAGTHFAVKYKILDSRKTVTIVQYADDYLTIPFIYVGKIYEIVVISINGNGETSSDPQEVILKPCSTPVHSVGVFTVSNTSVNLSWKQPEWFAEDSINGYFVQHVSKSTDKHPELTWGQLDYNFFTYATNITLRDIKPNLMRTYIIIPNCKRAGIGFDYRVDYSIESIQTNQSLAKPDGI